MGVIYVPHQEGGKPIEEADVGDTIILLPTSGVEREFEIPFLSIDLEISILGASGGGYQGGKGAEVTIEKKLKHGDTIVYLSFFKGEGGGNGGSGSNKGLRGGGGTLYSDSSGIHIVAAGGGGEGGTSTRPGAGGKGGDGGKGEEGSRGERGMSGYASGQGGLGGEPGRGGKGAPRATSHYVVGLYAGEDGNDAKNIWDGSGGGGAANSRYTAADSRWRSGGGGGGGGSGITAIENEEEFEEGFFKKTSGVNDGDGRIEINIKRMTNMRTMVKAEGKLLSIKRGKWEEKAPNNLSEFNEEASPTAPTVEELLMIKGKKIKLILSKFESEDNTEE